EDVGIGIGRVFLIALSNNCPPFRSLDAERLVTCLLTSFISVVVLAEPPASPLGSVLIQSSPGGNEIISNVSWSSSNLVLREVETPSSSEASLNGSIGWRSSVDQVGEEGLDSLEKQAIALRLIGHIVDKVPIKHELLDQVRMVSKKQLQSLLIFLKIRKCDWAEDGAMLKATITSKLSVYQAAALVQIRSLASFDLDGVAKIVVTRGGQLLRVLLICLKPLVLAACAQADTWGGSEGSMFGSVIRTSCEIIEYGWNKDRGPVETLIMGLTASIRERNDYEEQEVSILTFDCLCRFINVNRNKILLCTCVLYL
ncbi:hypothetical protein IFM89_035943, partial [Coptis chinensis]